MDESFKISNDATLIEYRGNRRTFRIYREGDLLSEFSTWCTEGISQVTVPGDVVKHIDFKAFKNGVDLKEIILGEGVISVELGAFWGCDNLLDLWIGHSIRRFSVDALPVTDKKLTLHVNYARGAWKAMKRAGFVLRNIPKDLWEAHSGLFLALKMANQKVVNLNLHVQRAEDIADNEFLGMPFDCTVTFHGDIRAKYLFQRSMPSAVVIEKRVSYINPDAFLSRGEVYFDGTNIKCINVVAENTFFYSKEGVLFDGKSHILIRFPQGKADLLDGSYRIPADTKTVAAGAFDGAYTIVNLVVPKGVVLAEDALANMPKLELVCMEE